MTMKTVGYAAGILFFWVAAFMSGGLVAETVLLYPNILHDVPASIELGSRFLAVTNPGDYFPPLGMTALVAGVVAIVINWRTTVSRYWFLGGTLILGVGDFLLSALYMWDRNRIMFQEGAAVHSVAYLQQVVNEFETAHWFRIAAGGLAAVCAFLGMLRLHRDRVAPAETASPAV